MFDEPPSGRDGARLRRGLPLYALALLALLALVAVASSGHRAPKGGRGAGPSPAFFDYVVSTYLVLAAVMAVVLVYAILTQAGGRRVHSRRRELRSVLAFVLAMGLATFLLGGRHFKVLERIQRSLVHAQAQQKPSPPKQHPGGPPQARSPEFRWIPAATVGAFILAGVAVYVVSRRRRSSDDTDDEAVAEALAAALDDALADLRAERDPRRAIIAAYARMERLLAVYGAPRRASEAPFEYLSRVLIDLHVGATPVFELTALFERAKFSHHEIEPEMKDEAIDALAAVRDELRKAA